MSEQQRVLVDMTIEAPVEQVWAALREPMQIRRWFGWDADTLAGEIEEIFIRGAAADPEAKAIGWPDGGSFVLDEVGPHSTRLQVFRQGHPGDWDGIYDAIDEGWITFTQQLRFALERHPGEDRRTVAELEVDLGPEDDPLLERLGLRPVGQEPVGSTYRVPCPDESAFEGEVYFQTDLQVGLTVEDSSALLVIARVPPSTAPPNGRAMFLLSAYGLDDDAFAALERRWRGWWSAGNAG